MEVGNDNVVEGMEGVDEVGEDEGQRQQENQSILLQNLHQQQQRRRRVLDLERIKKPIDEDISDLVNENHTPQENSGEVDILTSGQRMAPTDFYQKMNIIYNQDSVLMTEDLERYSNDDLRARFEELQKIAYELNENYEELKKKTSVVFSVPKTSPQLKESDTDEKIEVLILRWCVCLWYLLV
eukprot:m.22641 g.22641  ORF g.22641 m.22641 type:complete len:183 (-) comp5471_c0_seq1:1068-1616(-)